MPKKARIWVVVSILIQVAWSLPVGLVFGIRWFASEQDSELVLGAVFTGIAVIMIIVAAVLAVRWIRRGRVERHLTEHGLRADAVVTQARPTNSRINGQVIYKLRVEAPAVSGLEFQESTMYPVPPGTRLMVAYDPVNPSTAIILDDLQQLAFSLRFGGASGGFRAGPDAAIQRLSQLDGLRRSGAISEEEFNRLKAEVLDGRG
ncbi:SHOCT domain-containing protein [Acrocarpospora catenulata]|uniref:SHOCT domain-containing protein n=1 Tax=Acrocarpospora catenulata TaxID=2836182 RepID=UPI001BD990F7|nr:DUF3592 domain-containing protein [Acrocarpospora catenulata]